MSAAGRKPPARPSDPPASAAVNTGGGQPGAAQGQ